VSHMSSENRRGSLIAIEGIDGSGLTTHSEKLAKNLEKKLGKHSVVRDKEPSTEVIGDVVWHAIRGFYPSLVWSPVLALLFAADRLHHLYRKIPGRPAEHGGLLHQAARGKLVVLDRYKYSSMAYQTTDPHMPLSLELVGAVNRYAPPPHILVYLDVSAEVAVRRIANAERGEIQLYEGQQQLERVKQRFDEIVNRLKRSPEYCPGQRPPWLVAMENQGVDTGLYQGSAACLPAVIHVHEVVNGQELGEEEIAEALWASVVYTLTEIGTYGLEYSVYREAEATVKRAQERGVVEVVVHKGR
jgi:dTMP kinase